MTVRQFMREAASPASIPACPLPITRTSYLMGSSNILKRLQDSLFGVRQQIVQLCRFAFAANCRCYDFKRGVELGQNLATRPTRQDRLFRIGDEIDRDKFLLPIRNCRA